MSTDTGSDLAQAKWACEYCTYENYPSSLKCTMCRGPKPFVSEDIYRLRDGNGSNDCTNDEPLLLTDSSTTTTTCTNLSSNNINNLTSNENDFVDDASSSIHYRPPLPSQIPSPATSPLPPPPLSTKLSSPTCLIKNKSASNHSNNSENNVIFNNNNNHNNASKKKINAASTTTTVTSSGVGSNILIMSASGNNRKWTCDNCAHANSSKEMVCQQCGGTLMLQQSLQQQQNSPVTTTTTIHNLYEQMQQQPIRLTTTPSQNSSDLAQSLLARSRNNSPPTIANLENISSRRTPGKWVCSLCTYENWAKTKNCAMCGNAGPASVHLVHSTTTSGVVMPPPPPASSSPTTDSNTTVVVIGNRDNNETDSVRSRSRRSPEDVHSNNSQRNLQQQYHNRTSPVLNNMDVIANNQQQTQLQLAPPIINCENNEQQQQQQQVLRTTKPRHHQHHRSRTNADWNWLNACMGVIEGDPNPVEAYLASGGNPARTLTASEVALLNRSSAFDVGHTLVHLAIRFQREDLLAVLLSQIEGSGSGVKRVPSYVAPDLAADIRRHFASTLRQRKGDFQCNFVTDFPTFALPAEVEELPAPVQEQLFNELLDKDAQCQLESEPAVINWSLELTVRLGSRLYALWNRSAGDCLLDSVMQATYGVFDRDNTLRRALAESLTQSGHMFYPRWKEYETSQASFLQYSLDEGQWDEDWTSLLTLASQPGTSLEQLHVFALAHILRRPVIVYGVKYVKSFRGEALGYARFEGVYLPLLWDQSFCVRTPIALGYTRGHFSALVPLEPYSRLMVDPRASVLQHHSNIGADQLQSTFLPLMDKERKLLPIHFLTEAELGREETILRQWLDVCETEGGILVAQQLLHKRPLLVAQMVEEWLNHYRRLIQMTSAPFVARPVPIQDYLSEGDTDDE